MGRLGPCSRKELLRKLRELGFKGPFPGGSHSWMERGKVRVIIPNPHGTDIDPVLLRKILRQAGISITDWQQI